jgi:hypothetical protein
MCLHDGYVTFRRIITAYEVAGIPHLYDLGHGDGGRSQHVFHTRSGSSRVAPETIESPLDPHMPLSGSLHAPTTFGGLSLIHAETRHQVDFKFPITYQMALDDIR